MHDPVLPGSILMASDRGMTRISLTRTERMNPVILAFRRNSNSDTAFAGPWRSALAGTAPALPPLEFQPIQSLQLGGFMDRDLFFNGHLGNLYFFERALSDAELQRMMRHLEQRHGVRR